MRQRARRSLKASTAGISQAKEALLNFESKIALADELEMSRATVQKFFTGKPIGRENFHKICVRLKLPWQAIADLTEDDEYYQVASNQDFDIDALVQEVRQKGQAQIQAKCGIMRVLDMSQPIELNDIYTNVNILEKISSRQRLEVADLLKASIADEFERPNLGRIQDRMLGIEAVRKYSKLFVLGKPGAGKTTFLKHIAIQCSSGQLAADLVPIFITFKDFATLKQQPSLIEYITEQIYTYGITDVKVAQQLLAGGRLLILLDGLDEVREADQQRILKTVSNLLTNFPNNRFIITCRLAAKEYNFANFTEVEISDFNNNDITIFASKWFAVKDPNKIKMFLQKLFKNGSIQELATNPLLLTLLCLVFEESADFPTNRSELYQEGLDILLKKWDSKRNIERENIYKNLSTQHKKDLLSQIALSTFSRGEYFFTQSELEQHIANYIKNLLEHSDILTLQLNSKAVLKSIEAQHGLLVERARGIYSFSHLTFQEYFTAREIVATSNPQILETSLDQLVNHITDKRWREVVFLTVGMLRNADYLLRLMKQKIDQLLAEDPQLQAFLEWLDQKSGAVSVSYKSVIVRAFYFDLAITRILAVFAGSLELSRLLDQNLTRALERALALDLALDRTIALHQVVDRSPEPHRVFAAVMERVINHANTYEPHLAQKLQQLKDSLPELSRDKKHFKQWWKVNSEDWSKQLRETMIAERDLGHNWQFSKQQKELLKQYYDANKLLVECLNSNYYVTRTVRSQIENNLLLPLARMD